ncbi:MAG: cytochrome c oxidase subunit 3 [Alphaproteobacteria bacterium]|jgi:cytochrome c oxidase subunit III|nr:cytochrome c oxidase subunit 3 [Rhodospirillaceae bacterium]MDG2482185.1 cytochrome c oxidase subunit 3 [Alphaproteobacteria bacterium]MBT6203809.1 cytochrome c oxidase subunit 3 [Rhodospirillaceae bacterium]MBT6509549.1 cytochrome c oxidase subunit 3 [Rhodospirillaceae bacterium]MBT7615146.1 cytochrome c oxidase subunit 3 [Rhodospirillaceae bacterium]
MADHAQKHPYHLVDPSPWPVMGAFSALVLAGGAIMMFADETRWWMLLPGLVLVMSTMFFWWCDVIREAQDDKAHTPVVQIGLRYGMTLFIASEVMFFVAWFWAYFNAALYPTMQMGDIWPPAGVLTFDPWDLPFINTLILLTSGTTVTWAHHALREGNRDQLIAGLWVTVVLGLTFTCFQAVEYLEAPFGFRDGIYGSTFYMATGFHGFHVIVGTIFLGICLIRAYRGDFTPGQHFGFEAAAWYWHFVDVVWLFLFCCIYWWGAGEIATH